MNRLNSGFSQESDDSLTHIADTIVTNVGANPRFSGLAASLPPITQAADALRHAIALPAGPARDAAIAAARAALINLLQPLAAALEIVPGVTETDLAGSGFTVRQVPTHTSAPPDAPQNVRVKTTGLPGQLQILLAAVPRAAFYEVEYTLGPRQRPVDRRPRLHQHARHGVRGPDARQRLLRARARRGRRPEPRPLERRGQRDGDVRREGRRV